MLGKSVRLQRGCPACAAERAAREVLLADVLGLTSDQVGDQAWTPFCLFDVDGTCVANIDAAIMPLVVDGAIGPCASIRSVAVDPRRRGCGLFRALMAEVLAWCDPQADLILLYTAEPALYTRFGFQPVAQHAFVGPAPASGVGRSAGLVDLAVPADRARVAATVAARVPISIQAALMVGPTLFMTNLAGEEAPMLAVAPSLDAAIAFEEDGDTLVIVDVATPRLPPLATMLGVLGRSPRRIKTLFPPDRLGWRGEPIREDTGLMARGALPAAMTRPFMFPPTSEF